MSRLQIVYILLHEVHMSKIVHKIYNQCATHILSNSGIRALSSIQIIALSRFILKKPCDLCVGVGIFTLAQLRSLADFLHTTNLAIRALELALSTSRHISTFLRRQASSLSLFLVECE